MKKMEDLDRCSGYLLYDDVGQSGDNQLTSFVDPPLRPFKGNRLKESAASTVAFATALAAAACP
jgi:hypothetical protein